MPVIATGLCNLIIYLVTGCFIMNDSDESDDDFFDAQQDNTQQRSIEQRVSRLEEQIDALSSQMSTILERLDTIVAASQSQPSESSRRPMRACHARKSRPPQTTTDHAASKAGRKPIPDSETESEAVDRDHTTASTASLLSGVMKDLPTSDLKSREANPTCHQSLFLSTMEWVT